MWACENEHTWEQNPEQLYHVHTWSILWLLSRLEKTLESRLLKTLEILVHTLEMIVNKLQITCVSRSVNTLEMIVNKLQITCASRSVNTLEIIVNKLQIFHVWVDLRMHLRYLWIYFRLYMWAYLWIYCRFSMWAGLRLATPARGVLKPAQCDPGGTSSASLRLPAERKPHFIALIIFWILLIILWNTLDNSSCCWSVRTCAYELLLVSSVLITGQKMKPKFKKALQLLKNWRRPASLQPWPSRQGRGSPPSSSCLSLHHPCPQPLQQLHHPCHQHLGSAAAVAVQLQGLGADSGQPPIKLPSCLHQHPLLLQELPVFQLALPSPLGVGDGHR